MDEQHLRISLLGRLTASYAATPLDLGGRRQRAVLAVLLLARGEIVPAERLIEAVWGDRAGDTAPGALQSYVSHLRRRLHPGGPHPDAFSHRAAKYSVLAVGIPGTGALEHAQLLFSALSDWDTGGIWPNFGPPHDARTARRAYDAETLARITEVADRYDPDGVLQVGEYARLVR